MLLEFYCIKLIAAGKRISYDPDQRRPPARISDPAHQRLHLPDQNGMLLKNPLKDEG